MQANVTCRQFSLPVDCHAQNAYAYADWRPRYAPPHVPARDLSDCVSFASDKPLGKVFDPADNAREFTVQFLYSSYPLKSERRLSSNTKISVKRCEFPLDPITTKIISHFFTRHDSACRNCLVGKAYHIKISDFGTDNELYACDYYKVDGTMPLPVRWMAWESIFLVSCSDFDSTQMAFCNVSKLLVILEPQSGVE